MGLRSVALGVNRMETVIVLVSDIFSLVLFVFNLANQ